MKVVVIGIGNVLAADDGVGIFAVRMLRNSITDERISFVESERGGFDLLDLLTGADSAVVVDALRTGREGPGSVLAFSLPAPFSHQTMSSLHTIGLEGVLAFGSLLGIPLPAEVAVLGVEASDTESFGAPLTAEVESALPHLVEAVTSQLRRHLPDMSLAFDKVTDFSV